MYLLTASTTKMEQALPVAGPAPMAVQALRACRAVVPSKVVC